MKIRVRVKPNSKKGPLVVEKSDESGDFLEVFVREQAVENKANSAVIKLLSEKFITNKTSVKLLKGGASKFKTFEIIKKINTNK